MLKHLLKIALRQFRKNKLISFLNLFGLSIGLASFLVISFYVIQESSYERSFENAESTYRIVSHFGSFGDQAETSSNLVHMLNEIPGIDAFTTAKRSEDVAAEIGESTFTVSSLLSVDSAFFDVFDYNLLYGNPNTVLTSPKEVVLTEREALRLFGRLDPIGELITLERLGAYVVTGVIKTPTFKSHLNFDMLISQGTVAYSTGRWNTVNTYLYVVLGQGANKQSLDKGLMAIIEKYAWPVKAPYYPDTTFEQWIEGAFRTTYHAQPIRDIYLYSDLNGDMEPKGNATMVYTFAIIAILILMIASINTVNLLTARSSDRAKEVGLRKVFGTAKKILVFQFMTESFLITSLSALLALGLAELAIQWIKISADVSITFSLYNTPQLIWPIIAFVIIMGVLSGIYPAFYLSSVKVTALLKGRNLGKVLGISSGKTLRNILVVVQFTFSIFLITATLFVYLQIDYLKHKDLGLQPKDVLVISNVWNLKESQTAFYEEIKKLPFVRSTGTSSYHQPGDLSETMHLKLADKENNEVYLTWLFSDAELFKTLGIEMLEGQTYSEAMAADTSLIILNEAAVKAYGFSEPLNERIGRKNGKWYQIIGIVEDFNYESLRAPVEPAAFFIVKNGSKAYINLLPGQENISKIKEVWDTFTDKPMEYNLLEANFTQQIAKEKQTAGLIVTFTLLAVVIACVGLFGLAVFTADQRTHEFGVRKVLGASINDIVKHFSYDFMRLIGVAIVLAVPLSIMAVNSWLQGFADRISLSAGGFILSGILALIIAFFTIFFQALRTGRLNPVETLRNE